MPGQGILQQKEEALDVGYCRVSTAEQNLDLQIDALEKAGCQRIFQDIASGAKEDRPGLAAALEFARTGDRLVVWRLDRLGRSLPHLIGTVTGLRDRGVSFASLTESLDSSSASGRLIFGIFSSLAAFERELIRERVMAGIFSAKKRGRIGGRPLALDEAKASMVRTVLRDPNSSVTELARTLGVSRSTIYRCAADSPQKAVSKKD
jgi:DNA invertase Pin-like site-specific DNA recombinase